MANKKNDKTSHRTYTAFGTYNETEANLGIFLPSGTYYYNTVRNLSQEVEGEKYYAQFVRIWKGIFDNGDALPNTANIKLKTIDLHFEKRPGKENALQFDPTAEKCLYIIYHTNDTTDIDNYIDAFYDRVQTIYKDVEQGGAYQELFKYESPRKAGMSLIVKA